MNKIIILVAPPRSLSTAFLRMMQARGDFKIFNEPTTALYHQKYYPHSAEFYIQQEGQDYQTLQKAWFDSLQDGHVFIKEMSFAFHELIHHQPSLLEQKQLHFAFLLRNPHHCIISYYNKMPKDYMDYIIGQLRHLTGYMPLYQSYQTLLEKAVNPPVLLHAEQLINRPLQTIQSFCQQMDIPFLKESLNWSSLDKDFNARKDWQEHKRGEAIRHWHHEAMESKNFHQPRQYAVDEQGMPLFSEIENPSHRSICQDVYDDYLSYYQAMMRESVAEH